MILRPLNDRVLIKPHVAPTETPSGLSVVEHYKPEQVGTVVAVGIQTHPRKAAAETLAERLDRIGPGVDADGHFDYFSEEERAAAVQLVRDLVRREPCVKPGDDVLFSWQAGQEIFLHDDDTRYLIVREDDLLAVIED